MGDLGNRNKEFSPNSSAVLISSFSKSVYRTVQTAPSTAGGRVQQPISLYFVVSQITGVKWKQKPRLQLSQGLVYTPHLVVIFFSK